MTKPRFKLKVFRNTSVKFKLSDLKQGNFVFLVRCATKFLNFFRVPQGKKKFENH